MTDGTLNAEHVKVYLRKTRINRGGYDDSGRYWGVGLPLYFASFEHGTSFYADETIRAFDRTDAKEKVMMRLRLRYPELDFRFAR